MTFHREPGHALTNQEIMDFWTDVDGPGGEELLEICDHAFDLSVLCELAAN